MIEDDRTICPIPHLGFCIYERCSFWDQELKECTWECLGEEAALALEAGLTGGPCIIHWTEDVD